MKTDAQEEAVSNLPNILSLFRLVCIPLVIVSLYFPGKLGSFLAALFFGLAFITDFLDGYFARKYGAVTVLGKFLDPMADKLLVTSTIIMLISLDRIPAWIVILIVAREMAITGFRSIAMNEGIVIQASALGKFKTVFQSIAVMALCIHYEYFNLDFQLVGTMFLYVALILTFWSGWAYLKSSKHVLFPKGEEGEGEKE